MGVSITNVDPREGAREIADTGDLVPFGGEVTVDNELAGHPPSGDPDDEKYDPGAGLLAQHNVWARSTTSDAKAAQKTKASRDAEAAKAEKAAASAETTTTEDAS